MIRMFGAWVRSGSAVCGMRIALGRFGRLLLRLGRRMAGMFVEGWVGLRSLLRSAGPGSVSLVPAVLGECGSRQDQRRGGEEKARSHASSPASGRTLTMRIMPACMW